MAYCESCGSELTDGVKFCKHCGARVGNLDSDSKGISASEFFEEAPEPDGPERLDEADGIGAKRGNVLLFPAVGSDGDGIMHIYILEDSSSASDRVRVVKTRKKATVIY